MRGDDLVNDVETVLAWHEAVNRGDTERLIELCTPDVVVGGPRGSGQGRELLREWFARAGIRLTAETVYYREGAVVVDQLASWPGTEPATVASVFSLRDSMISSITRHEGLDDAFAASGLTEADLFSS